MVKETNEVIDEAEVNRADNAARQSRWRARRDLELEGLTVKKMLALKAAKAAALSATLKASDEAMQRLSPEQRVIFDSEVFQEGMPDGSSAGFSYLRAQMHDVIECVKEGYQTIYRCDVPLHVDWVAEFYQDFVDTFPFAKPMAYPRSIRPVEEGEAREYPVEEFHSAVAKWSAFRDHDPSFTLPDESEPAEPTKRKRGRPKGKATKPPTEAKLAVDPTAVAKWTTPH